MQLHILMNILFLAQCLQIVKTLAQITKFDLHVDKKYGDDNG